MRKLLQELYECERMMKRAAETGSSSKRIVAEPKAQTPGMPTEPSNLETKTTTASPAVNPPASPASRPNSTSVPVAPTSRYPNGFVAATHDTVEGTKVQMVQRPDGTVALLLPDAHGNPQSLDPKSRTAYLRSANWDVLPHEGVPELDGTTYKFHVSPYGITREAVKDGNSTWTQMDPRTGQMRDPDVHFRYPQPEGVNTDSMLLQASAPIPKDELTDNSPSLDVRQYWDLSDDTLRYAYYDPATAEILPAESGDVERLRSILVSSPDTRYYEQPQYSDGSIEYTYETADGSYLRLRGKDGKDRWYSCRQDADSGKYEFDPYEGVPKGLDPTPSPLKPVTVSEGKPAEKPSETPAASQEPTTPADPEAARRAAYIDSAGERPEWTKGTPTESIWSDPTFQSSALTGLGVGLLGGLGGYALTGGRGGLAPWLMLGGGVGAGIGGLSGYNQWNTNKTEYDDILERQKEWDAGLAKYEQMLAAEREAAEEQLAAKKRQAAEALRADEQRAWVEAPREIQEETREEIIEQGYQDAMKRLNDEYFAVQQKYVDEIRKLEQAYQQDPSSMTARTYKLRHAKLMHDKERETGWVLQKIRARRSMKGNEITSQGAPVIMMY